MSRIFSAYLGEMQRAKMDDVSLVYSDLLVGVMSKLRSGHEKCSHCNPQEVACGDLRCHSRRYCLAYFRGDSSEYDVPPVYCSCDSGERTGDLFCGWEEAEEKTKEPDKKVILL